MPLILTIWTINYKFIHVHLKDADNSIWLRCGNCKSVGHAKCVLEISRKSSEIEKVHMLPFQNFAQITWTCEQKFIYGSKVKE